jgi:histidinol-phosphate aminotransferase
LVPYPAPQPLEEFAAARGIAPEQVLKLDQNENPYGCSPRALEALGRFGWYHVYPDPEHTQLRHRLAAYTGADVSSIVVGNGSDELIELLLRVFIEPGDRVVSAAPTFGYYDTAASAAGAEYVAVPRGAAFELDPDVVVAAVTERTKLILLASPNNPTGNAAPLETIRALSRLDVLVVVDEAYFEFHGTTALDLLTSGEADNVAVLRTFSKWAGLAGLRLGYGIFPPDLVRAIRSVQPPYSVGQAADVAGIASLDDAAYLRSTVARIVAERERLRAGLDGVGYLRTYPSDANFILCDVIGRSAAAVQDALTERGILVRRYGSPRLENCLRISVGRPEQGDRLLAALREIA